MSGVGPEILASRSLPQAWGGTPPHTHTHTSSTTKLSPALRVARLPGVTPAQDLCTPSSLINIMSFTEIEFTHHNIHEMCTIQWFSVYSQSCVAIAITDFRIFHHPKKKSRTHRQSNPNSPQSPRPSAATHLLSVSGDLLLLDSSRT